MEQFQAIIFDMDGLLLDSEKLALVSFEATREHFQLPDRYDVFEKLIGANALLAKEVLREGFAGLIEPEVFDAVWQERYLELTTERPIPLMSGVENLLATLKAMGKPMAVATSSKTEGAINKLTAAGIYDYFSVLVGGDQVEQSKPKPDIFLLAAHKLNSDAKHCLAFEDSENGVKAAHAAGMTVVQIPDLIQPSADLLALGHIVLTKIDDVIEYSF